MDPPRCHRLCDLFGTCSAFCVCLCFCFCVCFCVCFSACSRAPFAAGPFRMARKRALGFCRKAVHRLATMTKTLSVFFAFRFTFQDFARKLTSLLGRVPRLWTRLIALSPAPARLSRLPSSRSLFFWGDCSPERVRAISTARLCALPRLHLQPINVGVSNGPCVEILSWGGLRA